MLNQDRGSVAVEIAASAALRSKILEALANGGKIKWVPASKRLLRVLIADDNRDAAESMSLLVKLWGHDVCAVYDGDAALDAASAYQPDVLLLDMSMPKTDGCEAARQLRRQPRFKNALLIAITGWGDPTHRQLGEEAGFDLLFVKPVDPSTLEVLLGLERARLAAVPEAFVECHEFRRRLVPDQERRGRNGAAHARKSAGVAAVPVFTTSHVEGLVFDPSKRDES